MYIMKISMGAKIFCLLHSFEETVKHTSVHMSQQKPLSKLLVFSSDPVFSPHVLTCSMHVYREKSFFVLIAVGKGDGKTDGVSLQPGSVRETPFHGVLQAELRRAQPQWHVIR